MIEQKVFKYLNEAMNKQFSNQIQQQQQQHTNNI